MKCIQSTISLEPMTSRLPSILPAYKDNVLYFFNKDSINERNGLYTSNYGMIPINICLDKTNGCGEYHFACQGNVLSWERFSEYFHFFTDYYKLLQTAGHCGIVYSSATQYYDNEYYTKYASQLWYGSERDTYVELDELFAQRGGCVSVTKGECGISVSDNGIFKFFKESIVPSFDIPQDYIDYWNVTHLYYPDVVEWITWFYPRVGLYSSVTVETQCSGQDKCCDCVEYINRGGYDMYSRLVEWYDGIQSNILPDLSVFQYECYKPSCLKQIQLTNTIDDLGQESTLAEEYQVGIDYRHGSYSSNTNSYGGTVVSLSGTSLQLKENKTGFKYDENLLERQYDDKAFMSYTDKYVSASASSFTATNYRYYAYNANNQKVTGNTKDEIKQNIALKYPITSVNGYVHESNIYEIQKSEYGWYKLANGREKYRILVQRESQTKTPYIQMGTKTVYADFQVKNGIGTFTFANIFDDNGNKWTATRGTSGQTLDYIIVNDYVIDIDDLDKTTSNIPYYKITGYTIIDESETVYASGGSVYTSDENGMLSVYQNAKSDKANVLIYPSETSYTIYTADEISGTTSSKLSNLRALNLMTDDAGNTLNGITNTLSRDKNGKINTNYIQPIEGDSLEPIYQINNTSNVLPYKYTITDMDFYKTHDSDINYFVGDIITDMVFYYRYYPSIDSTNSEILDEKVYSTSTVVASSGSSLEAISASTKILNEIKEYYPNISVDENIKCDITYYIGATLYRKKGGALTLLNEQTINKENAEYVSGSTVSGNTGIKYTETLEFVKETTQYYLRKPSANELAQKTLSEKNNVYYTPLSYPIYTYRAVQQTTSVTDSDGNETTYPIANFYCVLNTYNDKHEWKYENYDMETYNGMQVFPTYREEYLQGIAIMPNVDADIYIDRGINAAFEKHLKLGEVTSLESLENYTNGYFKMMEN